MKSKAKRYDEGGILTDRYGNPVTSGSGEPVRTRFGKSEDKEDKYDLESVGGAGRRARTIEEQIGRKKEDSEESPRRKIEDYSKPSEKDDGKTGIAAGFRAEAPEPSSALEKKTSTPAPVKKAMKVAEEKKTPTPSKMTSAKETMEKGRAGAIESEKKPKSKDEEKYGKSKRLKAIVETFTGRDSGKSSDSGSSSKMSDTGKSERLKAISDTFKNAGRSYDNPFAKKYKSGGAVKSASSRADGIAQRGKTRGRMV